MGEKHIHFLKRLAEDCYIGHETPHPSISTVPRAARLDRVSSWFVGYLEPKIAYLAQHDTSYS